MVLSTFGRCALRSVLASAMLFVGACSFVLDTESLQEGEGSGGSGGARNCPPVADPCANCLGKNCCATYMVCAENAKCGPALMKLQECMTTGVPATCLIEFNTNGGPFAAALSSCASNNCTVACTS